MEFTPYPKTPRLFRDIVITEKIDGTNAAVVVVDVEPTMPTGPGVVDTDAGPRLVYAQSRNRVITPEDDNFGFARWVRENAETLATRLGPGVHFGEWWGSGIGRGYGLPKGEKRFSLFNVGRWTRDMLAPPTLDTVPTLYRGPFTTTMVHHVLDGLRHGGSEAAPGYDRPEGLIVYHTAAGQAFKVTLEGDEAPKGRA